MENIKIVSIEGNIGSGKSSLLANLKTYLSDEKIIIFLKEPVDEWANIKDENGITILEKFYADQHKYSFSFQMMAYISRLKILKDTVEQIIATQKKLVADRFEQMYINYDEQEKDKDFKLPQYVIITERSLFTDKMVFAKMLYDSGKIEHVNYQIYLNWFNTFADEFPIDKIIYVRTDPKICHKRIAVRHRDGEDNIPVKYLEECHKYHDNMLDKNSTECVCKVQLIIDGNKDIHKNKNILSEWIKEIENFIFS